MQHKIENFNIHKKPISTILEKKIFLDSFREYGIKNYKPILESLLISGSERAENYFKVLEQLRRKIGVKGIETLHKEFGIVHFDRYGAERMERQYRFFLENKDKPEKQKAKIAYSTYPYTYANDAFLSRVSYDEFEKFSEENGAEVIYSESGSSRQFLRNILFTRKYLGKISNLVISAHGSSDHITLNRKPYFISEEITPSDYAEFKDIDEQSLEALGNIDVDRILDKKAIIIVDACHTGMSFGIVQKLSNKIKRCIYATPEQVAYYKFDGSITIDHESEFGKIKKIKVPLVLFYSPEDVELPTRVFVDGSYAYVDEDNNVS